MQLELGPGHSALNWVCPWLGSSKCVPLL